VKSVEFEMTVAGDYNIVVIRAGPDIRPIPKGDIKTDVAKASKKEASWT
jgi:hypothetical protein